MYRIQTKLLFRFLAQPAAMIALGHLMADVALAAPEADSTSKSPGQSLNAKGRNGDSQKPLLELDEPVLGGTSTESDGQTPPVKEGEEPMPPPSKPQVGEEPVGADVEQRQRTNVLSNSASAQAQQGTLPPMVADIPQTAAPFGEVTDYSLGLTGPGSKWRLRPRFSITGIFDDNIYLSSNNKVSDFYFAISPGATLSYGPEESALKVRADYTASFLVFTKESSQDTVDQNAVARISYAMSKLTLGLNLGIQSLSGASIDVGDRVRRQVYYVGVMSNYVLDEKFSVDLNGDETLADYHGYLDSNETRIQSWLNYQAAGKLRVSLGSTVGFLDVQDGSGQTYEQLLGRVNYDATGKLVVYASGGVDLRQSDTTNVSPVFSIGAAYSPYATTTITLDIHERIYGSAALVGQDYRATGMFVTLNQQLRPSLSMFLSLGYENASYFAVQDGIAANRRDNYYFARVGPEWRVKPWCNLSSFYEFSKNDSTGIGSRSFTRNRVGVQANFSF